MYLIFDTETTGLPRNFNAPITDTDNWPRAVQIAWQLHDELGELIEAKDFLIQPDGYDIPRDAERIHGISTQLAQEQGIELGDAMNEFLLALEKAQFIVGQNLKFDVNVVGCELHRLGIENDLQTKPLLDTCTEKTAELLQLPGGRGGKFKLPTLTELHNYLFGIGFGEAHNATADVEATTRCFFELIRREQFTAEELKVESEYFNRFQIKNPNPIQSIGLKHLNLKEASAQLKQVKKVSTGDDVDENETRDLLKDVPFVHLHNHTQYTILQSTMDVNNLINQAVQHKMPAVALTDTANMMAAFHFEKAISKYNKELAAKKIEAEENGQVFTEQPLLPIIGCEMYVCNDHLDKKNKDNGYLIVLLAKNKKGYQNLIKLASIAYTEGMYYVPRIDEALIEKYKDELIVLTGGFHGGIPSVFLNSGATKTEELILWYKERFNDDLYIELLRNGLPDEEEVNDFLIQLSRKHQIKLVAANNTFYANREDAHSQDILICVRDSELVSKPVGKGREYRFGLNSDEFYFKSQDEMKELFLDLPEAILSIQEILSKIEPYPLAREVLLPKFDIPEEFKDPQDEIDGQKRGENAYLRHLTYIGAAKRYPEITQEIRDRLDFELSTVEKTGYPGYFLIVQDFCQAARDMGVSVGPGRGSAAGSAVAYCTGITNVDPIKYDLLFERFLNPDRISMPDIDIDFDDEGRGKVIDWVIDKYGSNQVAQIITYGTMAAKSAIKDAGRVLNLPLNSVVELTKLVPDNIGIKAILDWDDEKLAQKLSDQEMPQVKELRTIAAKNDDDRAEVLKQAKRIEGTVRNTGIHACGIIITPSDITDFVPVAISKDARMWCTQFDNSVAEEAGLLKMDFLGLKTLTLIKHAVENVRLNHGIELNPDEFPIDDVKTYELFQRGETVGIFQYESPGMQKYMRELKPSVFGDLIAMNALYRPGPLEYIPDFIKRKNGEQEIKYDLDACEEYLKETYGITVYQEQVMLLSQKLAGFTKGQADELRKAMGKKLKHVLDKLKPLFIEQGVGNGHDSTVLEKIWKDWEAFASYAFNKSHSTCYAWIAYQTAYLKANYPAEYMASVLTNNLGSIDQVSFFMEECKRSGIPVLGPDVNESMYQFTVNKDGAIRFGLGAIKGLGSGPVDAIIEERKINGPFKDIFDLIERVDKSKFNKKALESLAYAGGFDSFKDVHRAQYFNEDNGKVFLETAMKYGTNLQASKDAAQTSLFGDGSSVALERPKIPSCPPWPAIIKLRHEKEVVGMFISGHPLDDFKFLMDYVYTGNVEMLKKPEEHKEKDVTFIAIITDCKTLVSRKNGNQFAAMTIEDKSGSSELMLFSEKFIKFKDYLIKDLIVKISGKFEARSFGYSAPTDKKTYEFNLKNIAVIEDAEENINGNLVINLPHKKVDYLIMEKLEQAFNESTGSCGLKFKLFNPLDEMSVVLQSKTVRLKPNARLLKTLSDLNLEFEFQL